MTRNSSSGLGSRLRGGQRKEPGSKMENVVLRARRGKGTIQALTEWHGLLMAIGWVVGQLRCSGGKETDQRQEIIKREWAELYERGM